jgi:hypothetical protein
MSLILTALTAPRFLGRAAAYLWLAAGSILRLALSIFPAPVDDDTFDYLQMGHNLLHYGIYGTGTGDDLGPSTYRLPGYPIFLGYVRISFRALLAEHLVHCRLISFRPPPISFPAFLAAFRAPPPLRSRGRSCARAGHALPFHRGLFRPSP